MSNQVKTEEQCFDAETIAAFIENRLDVQEASLVAGHVMTCMKCVQTSRNIAKLMLLRSNAESVDNLDEMRDLVKSSICEAKQRMRAKAWSELIEGLRPVSEMLAAADGQSADQIQQKTAHKAGSVFFYSHGLKNDGDPNGWCVELIIPIHPTDDCELQFFVNDLHGQEVPSGLLTIGKKPLDIKDGFAHMPLTEFLENIKEPMVSVQRTSGEEIPGALVFA